MSCECSTAIGMGSTTILGRVHRVGIELGELKTNFHLSVVASGSTELLIGIDFLKFFNISIQLVENCLLLESGEKIPFVDFTEIPDPLPTYSALDSMAKLFGAANLSL